LKKSDEISSTEKLLDLIRNRQAGTGNSVLETDVDTSEKEYSLSFFKLLPFKKKLTLGVVIGHSDLTLVMVRRLSEQNWDLVDCRKIPFDQGFTKGDIQFSTFLKSCLLNFTRNVIPDYIWSSIPSAHVETRHLIIPKVPENQLPNVAYFSFKKVVPFNEEDFIFDFEVLDEVAEGSNRKFKIFAYTAPVNEVEKYRKLFSGIGFPFTGISIVPFAMQNILRSGLLQSDTDNVCTLYIGKDWSRIDIFSKGNLVLSRDIKTGMNSIVEAIRIQLEEDGENKEISLPAEGKKDNEDSESRKKEDEKFAEAIFKSFINSDSDISDKEQSSPFKKEELVEIVLPVIKRLVRQVERTLQHFTLNFGNEMIGKIYITGELSGNRHVVDLISHQLNYDIDNIDPFDSPMLNTDGVEVSDSISEKDSFAPAMGIAVSHNPRTPNFIYTYLQKGIIFKIHKINRAVFCLFIALIACCIGFFYYQGHIMEQKKDQIELLRIQLEQYSPLVDKELILKILSAAERKRHSKEAQAENHFSIAMLSELSQITPSNIRLTRINADFFRESGTSKQKKKNILVVEGIVFDKGSSIDSDLAVYMIKLGNSPIFKRSIIKGKSIQYLDGKKVLKFTARLELV